MQTCLHPLSRQRGAALFLTLCIVTMLMLMSVSAVRTALNAERSARGDRDRQVALQAAEAALADAERDIEGGSDPASARARMFGHGASAGFVAGCGGAGSPGVGLCLRMTEGAAPAWQSVALAEPDARSVQFGRFTGASMPHGAAGLPARLPRYVIELMPIAMAGHDAGKRAPNFYRITAIGFGVGDTTCVVLQSYYLKRELA